MRPGRTAANRRERLPRIDKLAVTGSSPVPPIEKPGTRAVPSRDVVSNALIRVSSPPGSDIVDVRVDFFPIGMSATSKRGAWGGGCFGQQAAFAARTPTNRLETANIRAADPKRTDRGNRA